MTIKESTARIRRQSLIREKLYISYRIESRQPAMNASQMVLYINK